jgi:hypothetical protein
MDQTTISLNLENLNDEERKLLMSLVEKGNKPKSKVWKPEIHTSFYILYSDGDIQCTRCTENCLQRFNEHYALGNIFPTQEAAEDEVKRRRILKRWKDLSIESGEEENAWDGSNVHYKVFYEVRKKCIDITSVYGYLEEGVHFTSEESIQAAIKKIGEDNVKRYILNIKE